MREQGELKGYGYGRGQQGNGQENREQATGLARVNKSHL